jgi:hypothetical protein
MGTATAKQTALINSLLREREVAPTQAALIQGALVSGALSVRDASGFIDALFKAPKKLTTPTVNPWDDANRACAELEVSFYAIPAGLVSAQRLDLHGNDYLFVRVRNYSGKRYMSRVHGSVGHPRYSRIDPRTVVSLAALMKGRHVEFAENWHKVSGNCGRCNATLTDKVSREMGIGPECRKVFGV